MAPSSGEEAMVDLLEQLQNFHPMMSKPFLKSNYLMSIVRSQFSSRLKNKKNIKRFWSCRHRIHHGNRGSHY